MLKEIVERDELSRVQCTMCHIVSKTRFEIGEEACDLVDGVKETDSEIYNAFMGLLYIYTYIHI